VPFRPRPSKVAWPIPCYFEGMSAHFHPVNDKARLLQHFGITLEDAESWPEEANPQDLAPIIRRAPEQPGARQGLLASFGLLPHWARDPTLARRTYNARSETAMGKQNFREAWAKGQRCAVPAECIYEPALEAQERGGRWQLSRCDGEPMLLAGLWSRGWSPNGAAVMTFTLLTVDASDHALAVHLQRPGEDARMVAMLAPEQLDEWLDCPPEKMLSMLRACPAEALQLTPAPPPVVRNAPTRISNIKGDVLI
jgi:putative SOS response-associated peptidase YedK